MRLAVLVSGTGSILEAMLDVGLPVSLVGADRPCRGLQLAEAKGIATLPLERSAFSANPTSANPASADSASANSAHPDRRTNVGRSVPTSAAKGSTAPNGTAPSSTARHNVVAGTIDGASTRSAVPSRLHAAGDTSIRTGEHRAAALVMSGTKIARSRGAGPDGAVVVRARGASNQRRRFDRDGYSRALAARLSEQGIDVVAMAGFGTVLDRSFFDWGDGRYRGRVLNTHPSLLPEFRGWHAVRDALAAGVAETGCTVHVAIPELDAGPVLAQRVVQVRADDDEAALHERIKQAERLLYPATIQQFLRDCAADADGKPAATLGADVTGVEPIVGGLAIPHDGADPAHPADHRRPRGTDRQGNREVDQEVDRDGDIDEPGRRRAAPALAGAAFGG